MNEFCESSSYKRVKSYLLELGDGLGSSEDPLGSVGSHIGGLAAGAAPEQLIELCDEQLVSPAEVVTAVRVLLDGDVLDVEPNVVSGIRDPLELASELLGLLLLQEASGRLLLSALSGAHDKKILKL